LQKKHDGSERRKKIEDNNMIYPHNFEQKIGFDQVRQSIYDLCLGSMGKKYVEGMKFSTSLNYLKGIHSQTAEFVRILQEHAGFPTQNYFDLRPDLERISIEGSYLTIEALFDFRASLESIFAVRTFVLKLEEEDFPALQKLASEIHLEKSLLQKVYHIIDEKGVIRSNASPALAGIRRKLIAKEGQIGNTIKSALRLAQKAGWTDKDAEVVMRNGRLLVPVSAGNKRQLKGFIYDQSSTGQTVYIEPAEVFELNNEIRELQNEERTEIIRILKQFSSYVRSFLPDILIAYRVLGIFDFIRAKSLYAIGLHAIYPRTSSTPIVQWHKAIHPLLYPLHKKQDKEVVPLDIQLDSRRHILIISGPNAGGKSVALKTIGLLQYMYQCGLLVPVREDSVFGIFNAIFVDIGDEQSIENDLSTYSSHLRNMAFFTRNANPKTLFLIDEFGTGTEPQLGGAIAEAVLENLYFQKAFGVVTTHYANLKLLAGKHTGIVNGAMLFDQKILAPVYQLLMGKPGSSFAFEIASKTGLPKKVLTAAKQKINQKHLDFEHELQQLEVEKKQLSKQKEDIAFHTKKLIESKNKYEILLQKIKDQRSKLLKDAKKEAENVIAQSNRMIEKTIAEIRSSQADKEKTKRLRLELKEEQEKLIQKTEKKTREITKKKKKTNSATDEPKRKLKTNLEIGDFVKIKDSDVIGEVIQIENQDVIISFNQIKMTLQASKLEAVDEAIAFKQLYGSKRNNTNKILNELNEKASTFKTRLDLRGKRGEEAMDIVRHYIDDAIMLKIMQVEIIHGKGDGILRKLIRDYLSTIPEIQSYGNEHIERGGSGITLVRF
jgi:DNA mismatch repair protein MutS2